MRYVYQAWDLVGNIVQGEFESKNFSEAKNNLIQQGLIIQTLSRKLNFSWGRKIKSAELTEFLNSLAWMLQSGVKLLDALNLILVSGGSKIFKKMLRHIKENIEAGILLSEALKFWSTYFDPLSLAWIAAGERTGHLEKSLLELVAWRERKFKIQKKIKKALIYPSIILGAVGLVLSVLMLWVVPGFINMFKGLHAELPRITLGVVYMSEKLTHWGWLGCLGGGIFWVGIRNLFRYFPSMQYLKDNCLLHCPVVKNWVYHHAVSKIFYLLAISIRAGVPLLTAISSTLEITQNLKLREILTQVKQDIWSGWALSQSFEVRGFLTPEAVKLLKISETASCQEAMLERLAEASELWITQQVDRLLILLEPVLMLLVGGIVGWIVLAMYAPIVQLGNNV